MLNVTQSCCDSHSFKLPNRETRDWLRERDQYVNSIVNKPSSQCLKGQGQHEVQHVSGPAVGLHTPGAYLASRGMPVCRAALHAHAPAARPSTSALWDWGRRTRQLPCLNGVHPLSRSAISHLPCNLHDCMCAQSPELHDPYKHREGNGVLDLTSPFQKTGTVKGSHRVMLRHTPLSHGAGSGILCQLPTTHAGLPTLYH